MSEWGRQIQTILDEIDRCIRQHGDEEMTLSRLADRLGYSAPYVSRKFREISGMQLRDYMRYRRLAFALRELRETDRSILDIAVEHGFSSHEAFTRAFKETYGAAPSEYRRDPKPAALRTIIRPFDCYLTENGGDCGMEEVRTYFVTIPAHKFLHVRNYESIGYWDFWQKQNAIPGQDYETVCGLLSAVEGKLDDNGGRENNSGSGQIMAYINDPVGRLCSWGIPLAECYGVRLPTDYDGEVPPQMILTDVPEAEYIVFEHGPFDFATENALVEQRIENAMKAYDYAASGCTLDLAEGRIFYFFHDPERFWKYIRPVRRCEEK